MRLGEEGKNYALQLSKLALLHMQEVLASSTPRKYEIEESESDTPALDAIGVGLFSTVQSRHRKSFMHAFLKPACR